MRKIIVTVTVLALILSIVASGLLSLFYSSGSPIQNPTVSAE